MLLHGVSDSNKNKKILTYFCLFLLYNAVTADTPDIMTILTMRLLYQFVLFLLYATVTADTPSHDNINYPFTISISVVFTL